MISLLPGPSEIREETRRKLTEIASSGLLSLSHRGQDFQRICRSAVAGLKRQMGIPEDYRVVFTASATAAMGVTLRSLVHKQSHHFVHGAFAARFHAMALDLGLRATVTDAIPDQAVDWRQALVSESCELLTITHNETSTGSMWPSSEMAALRETWPAPLLVVDATSSFGAMAMDWSIADLWFCSVQKCLGLPAGLGIMIAGPRALAVAGHLRELAPPHRPLPHECLTEMAQRMEDAQTYQTPNVLGIALLAAQMEDWDLDSIESSIREKARMVDEAAPGLSAYVKAPEWRSLTVHNLLSNDPGSARRRAEAAGFLIGAGYGRLGETCIRIANFPASTVEQYRTLLEILES